ncbi:MAG: hypothetical protein MJ132_05740, partial [Clostridia bacterium]|nr:hypothetical protein [Clostridia bacterium]
MKKSKSLLLKLCSAGLIFGVLLSNAVVYALPKTITVKDDFNDKKTLSSVNEDVWTVNGESIKTVELSKPGKVLQFNGKSVTAETAVLMTDWYYEIKSLSFDLKLPENSGSNDIFFFDFIDVDKPRDYCGDFSQKYGEPTCYETWGKTTFSSVAALNGKWTDFGFSSDTVHNQWVSVKVEPVSETSANIYVAPKGKPFTNKRIITFSGKHTFLNSAVVFGDYQFVGYRLDNIAIKTESASLKEDFEDGKNDLLKMITINENTDNFSFDIEEEGGVRKLAFVDSPVDNGIISNEALNGENEHLKDNDVVLNTTFNMTFSAGSSGAISYVFGLESNDSSPCCDNWAYVMDPQGGKIVHYDGDGKESVKATHTYGSKDVSVKLTLTKGGKLTVTANGKAITTNGVKQYEGYTGFSVRKDIKKTIYLDDVLINNTYYNVLTTKSIRDDFSENRLGTVGNSDYAFNAEGGSFSVNDGELIFSGLSDNSFFGPAYPYETCEVSFKLTGIYTTENSTDAL